MSCNTTYSSMTSWITARNGSPRLGEIVLAVLLEVMLQESRHRSVWKHSDGAKPCFYQERRGGCGKFGSAKPERVAPFGIGMKFDRHVRVYERRLALSASQMLSTWPFSF